ncbi:TIGR03750 family conjugal transfer protein [Pseudomonas sp. Irchel 3A5]|uniref:TIGR03750 family conjugal transfer protein n=1 Tax=Pseudomonas sp. Irchel 3A5 TaxID=2008911 RepID=UPI000BA4B07D|nr:TIGR03750 family conjugal transfer protein [Pseudomonas sp. Irchel 3A5]
MTTTPEQLPDGTLRFLPNRLNRQPVIVLGMTADELWLSVGLSALVGLVIGIALSIVTKSIAMTPTTMVAAVAAGIFFGGKFLRRLKRGKPQTWLYREMHWQISTRWPVWKAWAGGTDLLTRSGVWSTRRSQRR